MRKLICRILALIAEFKTLFAIGIYFCRLAYYYPEDVEKFKSQASEACLAIGKDACCFRDLLNLNISKEFDYELTAEYTDDMYKVVEKIHSNTI